MGCCGGKTGCKKETQSNKLATDSGTIEIKFGPENAYSLRIPVAHFGAGRRDLADQLRAAADILDKPTSVNNDQKTLPFSN